MTDIDPDMLLGNARNAIALGHTSITALSFTTLDEQLSNGGRLPTEWSRARRPNPHELDDVIAKIIADSKGFTPLRLATRIRRKLHDDQGGQNG